MFNLVPNLAWLRTFEAAARHLSFTAAADEVGLTQAAVSQQIKALEGKLGCNLFVRHHRALTLTDMGRAYLPLVQRALKDLALSTTGLFGPGFDNLVTIRAPISVALHWIVPRMARFRAEHPDIRVRLVSAELESAHSGERVDVDLRFGGGDWAGVQSEKIADERLVPICPGPLRDQFTKPADFLATALVHIIGLDDNWTRYFDANALKGQTGSFGVSVDSAAAAISVVISGEGCAIIPERLAQTVSASTDAIHIAGQGIDNTQGYYLVSHPESRPGAPYAKTFEDWLRQEMGGPSSGS